jgi:hypothetical protein
VDLLTEHLVDLLDLIYLLDQEDLEDLMNLLNLRGLLVLRFLFQQARLHQELTNLEDLLGL